MYKIVLLRHGESLWNKKNIFTGWTDIDLSKKGIDESVDAAKVLKKHSYTFNLAYTSVLKRAIKTLSIVLDELDLTSIPIKKAWQLNERHYGALQGLNKAHTATDVGEEQVHIWRRSYDVKPPALKKTDKRYPGSDPLYKNLKNPPTAECLKDTVNRVLPYWKNTICKDILAGKKIIISAHGNSLRALVKYLDNISEKDIVNLNIPTGIPLVYELDKNLKPKNHFYLGETKKINESIDAVKNQSKPKNIKNT